MIGTLSANPFREVAAPLDLRDAIDAGMTPKDIRRFARLPRIDRSV
jgi:hypothetical protein